MQPTVLRLSFEPSKGNVDEITARDEGRHVPGPVDFFIPATAEFVGTFIFTFLSVLSYLHTVNTHFAVSIFDGASIYILICILGRFSGAHFNPAQTLSVIFVGKCRLAIGFFMIFMQCLGAFFGAIYARCLMQDNAFALAMHAAMRWSVEDVYATSRLQYFIMELTLSTLVCCAYLFTGVVSNGHNGTQCATVVATARALVTFVGYATIGQTANMARTISLASAAYIFLSVSDGWRFIYIPLLVDLASAPVASLLYWVAVRHLTNKNDDMQQN